MHKNETVIFTGLSHSLFRGLHVLFQKEQVLCDGGVKEDNVSGLSVSCCFSVLAGHFFQKNKIIFHKNINKHSFSLLIWTFCFCYLLI